MSYFDDNDNDIDKYIDSDDDDKKDKVDEEEDEEVEVEDEEDVDIEEDEDDDEDIELEDDELVVLDDKTTNVKKKNKEKVVKELPLKGYTYVDDDDDDDENDDESYLKKFDKELNENYLVNFHPECVHQNYDEILALCNVIRNKDNIIIDDLHRTIPYLTKYERARILGQRAKQINSGATPFVKVPENVIDGYLIAELELNVKRIPFIIRRPLPNGGSEYWKISDLENILY
jgi:DNA-directed RNA polymerase I, II, and III subunit RPABC2